MAQINTAATKHGELQTVYSSGLVIDFKPFPGITAVDKTRLAASGFEKEYDPELVGSLELYSYLLRRMG